MSFSSPAALTPGLAETLSEFTTADLTLVDNCLREAIQTAQATYSGISALDKAESGFCCSAWARFKSVPATGEESKGYITKQAWGTTLMGSFSIRNAHDDNQCVAYLQSPLSRQLLNELFTSGWLPRFVHEPYTDQRGYSNSGSFEIHLRAPRAGALPQTVKSSEDRFPTPEGLGMPSSDFAPDLTMLLLDDCLRTAAAQAYAGWEKLSPAAQQATGHRFTARESLAARAGHRHRDLEHYTEGCGCRFTARLLLGKADEAIGTAYFNGPLFRKVQAELVAAGWEVKSTFKAGNIGDDGEMCVWYCGIISLDFAAPGTFAAVDRGQRGWLLRLLDFTRKA